MSKAKSTKKRGIDFGKPVEPGTYKFIGRMNVNLLENWVMVNMNNPTRVVMGFLDTATIKDFLMDYDYEVQNVTAYVVIKGIKGATVND